MANNPTIFEPANRSIVDDIKKELRLQGHRFTGTLEASFRPYEVNESGGVTLTSEALPYLQDLEQGIPASQIVNKRTNVTFLATWVRVKSIWKGCTVKESFNIAYAIINKWKKEGFELEGAKLYSETGRVNKAVSEAFDKNQPKIIGLLDTAAIGSLDNIFHEVKSGTV